MDALSPDQERRVRDCMLALFFAPSEAEALLYESGADIDAIGREARLDVDGTYVFVSRYLCRKLGPRQGPLWIDFALSVVQEDVPEWLQRATRKLMQTDRKVFDTVQGAINHLTSPAALGKPLPEWLAQIAGDIASKLKRPKQPRGRPSGAGASRDPFAQFAIALNVHLTHRLMRLKGHERALYNRTNPTGTVCEIVATALTEEGLLRTHRQVEDAYCEYADQMR